MLLSRKGPCPGEGLTLSHPDRQRRDGALELRGSQPGGWRPRGALDTSEGVVGGWKESPEFPALPGEVLPSQPYRPSEVTWLNPHRGTRCSQKQRWFRFRFFRESNLSAAPREAESKWVSARKWGVPSVLNGEKDSRTVSSLIFSVIDTASWFAFGLQKEKTGSLCTQLPWVGI